MARNDFQQQHHHYQYEHQQQHQNNHNSHSQHHNNQQQQHQQQQQREKQRMLHQKYMRLSDNQFLLNIPNLSLSPHLMDANFVSPNVSPFETQILGAERPECATSTNMPLPIINVENLNVFSVDEAGQFNTTNDTADMSTVSADCGQRLHQAKVAAAAAAASMAYNLVNFFKQNASNHSSNVEESRASSVQIQHDTNRISSASASPCSVRTIQTIELGYSEEFKPHPACIKMAPIREENYDTGVCASSYSYSVDLIPDGISEITQTPSLTR